MRSLTTILASFLVILWSSIPGLSQVLDSAQLENAPVHYSLEDARKNPDSVYILVLRRKKFTEFPEEIFHFRNLNELDISRNKIGLIPRDIGTLINLIKLDVSKNKLITIPPDIGNLKNLKRLIIYQNDIAYLPSEIGDLVNLEYLDMWGNELETMPVEIGNLKKLTKIDMRVIEISDMYQRQLHDLLPNTNILFSNSCDCGG